MFFLYRNGIQLYIFHNFLGMVSILNSFEERLSKLEATILPVYQETDNLRRRQENIDRTLEALDHVIGFYNVSKGNLRTFKVI